MPGRDSCRVLPQLGIAFTALELSGVHAAVSNGRGNPAAQSSKNRSVTRALVGDKVCAHGLIVCAHLNDDIVKNAVVQERHAGRRYAPTVEGDAADAATDA